jgi:D-hydroxyproline dehydrogenase subunit alpha
MVSSAQLHFEVVVIGGGPAGMAAAVSASKSGATVAIVDDNPAAGGQIWRGEAQKAASSAARHWFWRLRNSPIQVIPGARVFHLEKGRLTAETNRGVIDVAYREVILATGARELFLPFTGWMLPNVFGAGGLQALMKTGLPVEGKSMVIAGTGPLLFAVAWYARKHGAKVLGICEQTSFEKVARFAMATARVPGKIKDALRFLWELRGIPYWTNCWPVQAIGRERLERVRLSHNGHIREMESDYLACGFHLIPNLELAKYLGCAVEDGFVRVDDFQRTSLPHVYCAGEPTSIGGLEMALVEGQIAGYAATRDTNAARRLFSERARYARFAAGLKAAFQLRPELKSLADPETFICRCEDVAIGLASRFNSWRAAKLHTRCGMGPCQGRVCGAAAEFLFGWDVDSVRLPIVAVQCASLAMVSSAQSANGTALN